MIRSLFAVTAVALASSAFAQTGIDGVIDLTPVTGDWSGPGVITNTVLFNPAAPLGNFGAPTNENHTTAYTTYMRGDGSYIYLAVSGNTSGGGSGGVGLAFLNAYLSTTGTGSNIGIEVTNDRFFTPGVPGYVAAGAWSTYADNALTGVVEVAIPYSFFTSDPLGMGFGSGATMVQWRLSQALGYSVAGGAASYGNDRLGVVLVPTPGAAALVGLGGLTAMRRRRSV